MNIGQFDQYKAALVEMALIVREHYLQMVKAGFTPQEAIQLSIDFQRDLMTGGKK